MALIEPKNRRGPYSLELSRIQDAGSSHRYNLSMLLINFHGDNKETNPSPGFLLSIFWPLHVAPSNDITRVYSRDRKTPCGASKYGSNIIGNNSCKFRKFQVIANISYKNSLRHIEDNFYKRKQMDSKLCANRRIIAIYTIIQNKK